MLYMRANPFFSFLSFLVLLCVGAALPLLVVTTQEKQAATTLLPIGQTGDWTMIFDDEFNETKLDSSKWNTCFSNFSVGPNQCIHDQNELELYTSEGVILSNGTLTLRAEHKSVTGANGKTYQYPSGMISSGPPPGGDTPKFQFRYGYVEMKAILPTGNGLWPAFWMISAQRYPPEIDNFEVLGESPKIINMHFHPEGGGDSGFELNGPDTSAGWHTYGLDWEPGYIRWYVDGRLARNLSASISPDIRMYLIANLAVGGDWPVSPDSSTPFPANFQIDYMRVWQKGIVATTVTPPVPSTTTISPTPLRYLYTFRKGSSSKGHHAVCKRKNIHP